MLLKNQIKSTYTFGKAFRMSLLMVLIASTVYVISWMVDYFFFMPDFAERYGSMMINELKASGASQEEIAKQTKEMADFAVMYKNPFFNAAMTYMEILPVGLLVALISSLILKRKTVQAS